MVPTEYYLILSAILFGLGAVAFVFKRNIITIFMSIELMLNAVNLAFAAFVCAGFDLQVGQLHVVMVLVGTGVGFLVHIYATGYMAHEGGYYRFFSYLSLFLFFMLILVRAAHYVRLFVGWEGVGLASC